MSGWWVNHQLLLFFGQQMSQCSACQGAGERHADAHRSKVAEGGQRSRERERERDKFIQLKCLSRTLIDSRLASSTLARLLSLLQSLLQWSNQGVKDRNKEHHHCGHRLLAPWKMEQQLVMGKYGWRERDVQDLVWPTSYCNEGTKTGPNCTMLKESVALRGLFADIVFSNTVAHHPKRQGNEGVLLAWRQKRWWMHATILLGWGNDQRTLGNHLIGSVPFTGLDYFGSNQYITFMRCRVSRLYHESAWKRTFAHIYWYWVIGMALFEDKWDTTKD